MPVNSKESFVTDQIQPVLQVVEGGRTLLDATDAFLLLLDHQAGLVQTVTGPLAELPGWLQAAGWGALSASGLLIGAVGGYYTRVDHQVHRHHSQEYAGCERHRTGDGGVLNGRVVAAHGPDQQAGCRQGSPAGRLQPFPHRLNVHYPKRTWMGRFSSTTTS